MPTRSNIGNSGEYLLRMRGKDATDYIAGDEQLLVCWNLERVQARFIAPDLSFSSRHLPIPAAIQLQASPFQTFADEGAAG